MAVMAHVLAGRQFLDEPGRDQAVGQHVLRQGGDRLFSQFIGVPVGIHGRVDLDVAELDFPLLHRHRSQCRGDSGVFSVRTHGKTS